MTRPNLKSLAHPDWPYAGTAHEWRGFVKDESKGRPVDATLHVYADGGRHEWRHRVIDGKIEAAYYQKQNFGPDLK
jgi:hypothetical protein